MSERKSTALPIALVIGCLAIAVAVYLGLSSRRSPGVADNTQQAAQPVSSASGAVANQTAGTSGQSASLPETNVKEDEEDGRPGGTDDNSWMQHANLAALKWSDYPASVLTGPFKLPDFNGADRDNREFRTILTSEAQKSVNFGGHYRAAWIGCGMGCLQSFVIDKATGHIEQENIGLHGSATLNEDNNEHSGTEAIGYRPNSRLILELAHDTVNGTKTCFYNAYEWNGHMVKMISSTSQPAPADTDGDAAPLGGYCSTGGGNAR